MYRDRLNGFEVPFPWPALCVLLWNQSNVSKRARNRGRERERGPQVSLLDLNFHFTSSLSSFLGLGLDFSQSLVSLVFVCEKISESLRRRRRRKGRRRRRRKRSVCFSFREEEDRGSWSWELGPVAPKPQSLLQIHLLCMHIGATHSLGHGWLKCRRPALHTHTACVWVC